MFSIKNRAQEASSNMPGNSGTVSLSLSGATTNNRTFMAAGVASGSRVLCHIFQIDTPSRWVEAICTFTDATPDTLTFTAADVLDGSSGAGVLPTWTGLVNAGIEGTGSLLQRADLATDAVIQFDDPMYLQYVSSTSVSLQPGRAVVAGLLLDWASAITLSLTSGTAPLNAAGLLYLYLYSNAGTPALEASATAPEWNAAQRYYRKTSDSTRRCVGWLFVWQTTSSAYRIAPFNAFWDGHRRARVEYEAEYIDASNEFSAAKVQVLNSGVATTPTGFTLTPVPAHAVNWLCQVRLSAGIVSANDITGIVSPSNFPSAVANRNAGPYAVRHVASGTSSQSAEPAFIVPVKTSRTAYYSVAMQVGTGGLMNLFAWGAEVPL